MKIEVYVQREETEIVVCVTQYITKSLAEANMLCATFDKLGIEHEDDALADESYCIKVFSECVEEEI